MPTFVGLDGYSGGWVGVYLEEKRQRFHYAATVVRLLDVPYERAMIDIPIGLPRRGYRGCDRAAKEILGSSAFLGARWNVWQFQEYGDANAHYWKEEDTGHFTATLALEEQVTRNQCDYDACDARSSTRMSSRACLLATKREGAATEQKDTGRSLAADQTLKRARRLSDRGMASTAIWDWHKA